MADQENQVRDIPKGHSYDKKALKPVTKALWAASVALGHALTAHRYLSRLKSTTVSPDGMLGGKGYTSSLKDLRQQLAAAIEALSAVSDTLYDEMTAPHWTAPLKQLSPSDQKEVTTYLSEAEEVMDDPESAGEEAVKKVASSLPVNTIPGGPRVEHIGPGGGNDPDGDYSLPEDCLGLWSETPGYTYETPWANITKRAESSLPGGQDDPRNTDAHDWGIGFGADGKGVTDIDQDAFASLPQDNLQPVSRRDEYRGLKDRTFRS